MKEKRQRIDNTGYVTDRTMHNNSLPRSLGYEVETTGVMITLSATMHKCDLLEWLNERHDLKIVDNVTENVIV